MFGTLHQILQFYYSKKPKNCRFSAIATTLTSEHRKTAAIA
jgi:hypothetical protein